MMTYKDHVVKVNKFFAYNKKAFPTMHVEMISNQTEYNVKKQMFNTIPLKIAEFTSMVPQIGTP